MMDYKHYSFDLWLTLIKSDPAFKKERAHFFYIHFNRQQKSLEEVTAVFRQVDLMCNAINERTGKNIDAEEMYLMVISRINEDADIVYDIDIHQLYDQMEQLLLSHLPLVYSEETIPVLTTLKTTGECTVNVLSNTGFIKGRTLRKVLKEIKLSDYFDFQLYSDELGLSKPNPLFFQHMLHNVARCKGAGINLKEVIHIGDNPRADIAGASAVGIDSLLINSNHSSILSVVR
ncbi:HAD family hydrolase [Chitinophaga nivalis]|uniref:HAD family hydrolase n=1 Tax=Chitinophaga nivalis TaxID=2991709 RepID=A0ABT3IJ63_9BACT|nr:HAD family hydrolase [Chitinophaga nivalis]MCW3466322.1 HAD family hydrolase [Chitinophaga nivalis]MCW3483987.1 HAD family hydrolase [Chitinophaga nivalis]